MKAAMVIAESALIMIVPCYCSEAHPLRFVVGQLLDGPCFRPSARDAENGFVAGPNCFVARGATT
jgi:hypothetical protein